MEVLGGHPEVLEVREVREVVDRPETHRRRREGHTYLHHHPCGRTQVSLVKMEEWTGAFSGASSSIPAGDEVLVPAFGRGRPPGALIYLFPGLGEVRPGSDPILVMVYLLATEGP